MDRVAPPLALIGRVAGRPVHVDLREASTRWTVLVFERRPDARRIYELAAAAGNFAAEDAALFLVTPATDDLDGHAIPVVLDPHDAIRNAFGTRGAATLVIAPDGAIWQANLGTGGDRAALEFVAEMRTGGVRAIAA